MKRLWLFFRLSSAALLAGALLSLFFRDWVRDQVVIPIAYLFWVLRLLILSVPQEVYWGILVLVGLAIAAWASRPNTIRENSVRPLLGASPISRYSTWLRYTTMLDTSRFASDNLARDLIRLTVLILAYQNRLTSDEVYNQLEQEDLGLPPELRAFVRRRGFQTELPTESRLMELYHRLIPRKNLPRPPGVYTPLEQETIQVISQIERLISQANLTQIDTSLEEAAP